jgi:hypothetical protein
MAPLRGGTTANFTDSMAEAIEQALQAEWQAVKGSALTTEGQEDRRLLFAAIATGILSYLETHQNELINTITLGSSSSQSVTGLDLNIST